MKKLLILPLLVLLTACVQYYYPETAMEDGVYYAEDDPKYMVFQGGDPGGVYYPWYSLDYFYLGYNPYPIYPYYTGFPYGLMYGYGWSPWWVAGRYSSYHSLVYGYGPYYRGWRSYYGYCETHRHCGQKAGNHAGRNGNKFVGNQKDDIPINDKEIIDGIILSDSLDDLKSARDGSRSSMSNSNFIVTLPPGYTSRQGMIIRHNESTKTGRDKVQPVAGGVGSRNIIITAAPSTANAPAGDFSNRTASPPARAPVMSAPRHSSGASSRSRPRMSTPRSRPSKSRSSRPARDLD